MDVIKKFEPIFGDWYVESFIGAGGFGRVYKIYRDELGHRFYSALKYISIPTDDAEIKQLRFDGMDDASISTYYGTLARDISSETTMMNMLRGNTNIVSFEDSKIAPKPGGIGYDIFIRMELLESLPSRMMSYSITPNETVKLGVDICNALSLCSRHGIIHRDIKPDNIFVSANGDYKLGDFGIARQLEKTATFMSKKGTYNYMAPEVYKGEKYGASCDIYSLGLVLYRMLNGGRLPFMPPAPQPITPNDKETSILRRMKGEPLPAPCGADAALAAIVLKACEYDPNKRYSSAEEMRGALLRYLDRSNAGLTINHLTQNASGNAFIASDSTHSANAVIGRCKNCGAPVGVGLDYCPDCQVLIDAYNAQEKAKQGDPAAPEKTGKKQKPSGSAKKANNNRDPEAKSQISQPKPEASRAPAAELQENKKRTGMFIGIGAAAAAVLLAVVLMAVLGVFGGRSNTAPVVADVTDAPTSEPATQPDATDDPIVSFANDDFASAVREVCGFSGTITESEVLGVTSLDLAERGLTDINDIAKFKNLHELYLQQNDISSIASLRELTDLTVLYLDDNKISDISVLGELKNLRDLDLSGNSIRDISVLGELTDLAEIDLSKNNISDYSALSDMKGLTLIWLRENGVSDLSMLSGLTSLTELDLSGNNISDISQLSNLTDLETLLLDFNTIQDITPLESLTGLKTLYIDESPIKDLTPISKLTNLEMLTMNECGLTDISALSSLSSLKKLYLSTNSIKDLKPLKELTNLSVLSLNNNSISDISPLNALNNLSELRLSENNIVNISALKGLKELRVLYLANNTGLNDIQPLSSLTNIELLFIGKTGIRDISALKDMKALSELSIRGNTISDLSVLKELPNLTKLYISSIDLTDASVLSHLTKLTTLNMGYNNVSDLSFLSSLKNLTQLDLTENRVTDISFLRGLRDLKKLYLSKNNISDISVFKELPNLELLQINEIGLTDISVLSELTGLKTLEISRNALSQDQIEELKAQLTGCEVIFKEG